MATLVFLEHHEGEIVRNALGVLSKAAALGGEVAGVVAGSGVRELAVQAGEHGASRVYVADDPALEAPLPQPRVDVLASLVADKGFDTVLFGQSVLAADLASGLAARLDAGLNWDLTDIRLDGRSSSAPGPRSRTPSSSRSAGRRSPGSRSSARPRSIRRRRAAAPRQRTSRSRCRSTRPAPSCSSRRTRSGAGRRSRMPT